MSISFPSASRKFFDFTSSYIIIKRGLKSQTPLDVHLFRHGKIFSISSPSVSSCQQLLTLALLFTLKRPSPALPNTLSPSHPLEELRIVSGRKKSHVSHPTVILRSHFIVILLSIVFFNFFLHHQEENK